MTSTATEDLREMLVRCYDVLKLLRVPIIADLLDMILLDLQCVTCERCSAGVLGPGRLWTYRAKTSRKTAKTHLNKGRRFEERTESLRDLDKFS